MESHIGIIGGQATKGDVMVDNGKGNSQDTLFSQQETIVRVDRSVVVKYPANIAGVVYPELEAAGPAEYDLVKDVWSWFCDGQLKGERVSGRRVHSCLRSEGAIEACLGMHDALAIERKGVELFRRIFGRTSLYFWKSLTRHKNGDLIVPCLFDSGVKLLLLWDHKLNEDWPRCYAAARFKK